MLASRAEAQSELRGGQPPAVQFEHVALAFDDDVVLRDVRRGRRDAYAPTARDSD